MINNETVKQHIADNEGVKKLLYSDPSNPYESIYIEARIVNGALSVTDSECEHGPDGGWSHVTTSFDEENTEKVFTFLLERNADPFQALAKMMSYRSRTSDFLEVCDKRGIVYKKY